MLQNKYMIVIAASLTLSLGGCASFESVDGVSNLWREVPIDQFQKGITKQSDVLELLGPPSQQLAWGAAPTQPPFIGLNALQNLEMGANGVQLTATSTKVGQHSLELGD